MSLHEWYLGGVALTRDIYVQMGVWNGVTPSDRMVETISSQATIGLYFCNDTSTRYV